MFQIRIIRIMGIVFISTIPTNLIAEKTLPNLTIEPHRIVITNQNQTLTVSLACPLFTLEEQIIGGYSPVKRYGDIRRSVKEPFRLSYAPINLHGGGQIEIQLFIQWSPKDNLLHKWTRYRLSDIESPVLLKEIILDKLESSGPTLSLLPFPGQSYPVFLSGFFAGIEYPISSVRMESGFIVLAHQPGLRMTPGKWYESRKAVYCATKKGCEKEAFISYIAANRPGNNRIHINYNSWWTSPMPYSEKNILELIKTFEEKMYLPYGVSFNTFCIDMGWSDPLSIWGIDTLLFPKEFISIRKSAEKMKTSLGLWISPTNRYSPMSIDSEWAEKHGYETFIDTGRSARVCCLAGNHYSKAFRETLVSMVKKYGIKQLKFDGYLFFCPESDHGHEPGYLSIEPTAEALIETCRQIHNASPDTWIETTCMGWNPSPWWLFYANSVLGTHGDDSPAGRVPSPVFRESYTSARDFYNIQGATHLMTPIPAQEVLGIIHQTPESFTNDAVTTIMRGHLFLPLYLNPAFMDGNRWKMISDIISWGRNNASILQNTKILLPESWKNGNVPRFKEDAVMPREPYGYSHFIKNKGLIEIRNPWIKNCEYNLKIDSSTGFSKQVRNLNIVSIYPEVRIYAANVQYGETVNVPLAPYETLVLSVSDHKSLKGIPFAKNQLHGFGLVRINKIEKTVIKPVDLYKSAKNDSLFERSEKELVLRLRMEGTVEVTSPVADMLVLIEGNDDKIRPEGKIYINGKPEEFLITGSAQGWTATMFKKQEHWIFMKASMKYGENIISLELDLPESPQKVSVWSWARKPGSSTTIIYPNTLPQPEDISVESVNLIESFSTETAYLR
jgi:hypothetical protein